MALPARDVSVQHIANEIDELIRDFGYTVQDPNSVIAFLQDEEHWGEVITVLKEAAAAIPDYFPGDADRNLRVENDFESEALGPLLVEIAWPHEHWDDAYARLDRFDDGFASRNRIGRRTHGNLVFAV